MLATLLLAAIGAADLPRSLQEEGPAGSAFLDLDRLELDVWLGLVGSSSDFESDPQFGAGALLRAPMPWLSRDVLGLAQDDLGLFVQAAFSRIDRDLDPEPDNPDGSLFSATLGVDYALVRDESWLLLAQAGIQMLQFGDIFELDDGAGVLLGLLGGAVLSPGLSVTLNPQIWLGEGGDYLFVLGAGALIAF